MRIAPADLTSPDVLALLDDHLQDMHATSPACSVHALPVEGLAQPHVSTFAARTDGGELVGLGAIAELDSAHGELKSMRTAASARGQGVGAAMLTHLLDEAHRRGYQRVSLETGSQDFFAPARRLYERFGFDPCPPFADYVPDPASAFYALSVAPPMPRNPARMSWAEIPEEVVAEIEDAAGARVAEVLSTSAGFSPGFAGRVRLEGGDSVFLKIMSATRDPWSIGIMRDEARIAAALPDAVAAPRLRWSLDDGEWVALSFDAIDGREPEATDATDREAVYAALEALAEVLVPADAGLASFAEAHDVVLHSWKDLAEDDDYDARAARLGSLRPWVERNLDALVEAESTAGEHSAGDSLVHADVRTDNMLIAAGKVWIVDWPWACTGAPWLDLAAMVPSMSMVGAGPSHRLFHEHPLSRLASPEAERAFVASLAGFFIAGSTQPELPALPGLRQFQRAQALPTVDWLRTIATDLA